MNSLNNCFSAKKRNEKKPSALLPAIINNQLSSINALKCMICKRNIECLRLQKQKAITFDFCRYLTQSDIGQHFLNHLFNKYDHAPLLPKPTTTTALSKCGGCWSNMSYLISFEICIFGATN